MKIIKEITRTTSVIMLLKSLALSGSAAVSNEKETSNSNVPNQYARVENIAKVEGVIKDNTGQTYGFVD
jgi:hypothetical protein